MTRTWNISGAGQPQVIVQQTLGRREMSGGGGHTGNIGECREATLSQGESNCNVILTSIMMIKYRLIGTLVQVLDHFLSSFVDLFALWSFAIGLEL